MLKRLTNNLTVIAESSWFSKLITGLILVNAIILGLETYPKIMAEYGAILIAIDHIILWIFLAELTLRFAAYGIRFFLNPWNIFDTTVVAIAFVPANEAFSVLRVARVLRVLRLISVFPKLRRIIEGLIIAIPGIGSIGAILSIILYVFAIMATNLFGESYPNWFGTLGLSIFSLFQIMTLEGWGDMVREIKQTHQIATPFFIIYILISTFTVLNLFIAVIVEAMQREHQEEGEEDRKILGTIRDEIVSLHKKIELMNK